MPEHRIRFRGAWDWHVREGEVEFARRVTLPADWPVDVASPFRLVRRFGRPPFDPAVETVRLELIAVPGLVAARLNGRGLGGPPEGAVVWSVPLDEPLLPRNVLVLEVDLGAFRDWPGGWGAIALVIAPRAGPTDRG